MPSIPKTLFTGSMIACTLIGGAYLANKSNKNYQDEKVKHFKDSVATAIASDVQKLQNLAQETNQLAEGIKEFKNNHPALIVERKQFDVSAYSDEIKRVVMFWAPYEHTEVQIARFDF
jgi:cell division protein FtsB